MTLRQPSETPIAAWELPDCPHCGRNTWISGPLGYFCRACLHCWRTLADMTAGYDSAMSKPLPLQTEPAIPCLPLWQPWASLVVLGAKQVETRHWQPPARIIGQRIAIHATKTDAHLGLRRTHPFVKYLYGKDLPLGALIGSVYVAGWTTISPGDFMPEGDELAFGDYTPGRFAWHLTDPEPLDEPIPWKGSQGIFKVPAEPFGVVPAQASLL